MLKHHHSIFFLSTSILDVFESLLGYLIMSRHCYISTPRYITWSPRNCASCLPLPLNFFSSILRTPCYVASLLFSTLTAVVLFCRTAEPYRILLRRSVRCFIRIMLQTRQVLGICQVISITSTRGMWRVASILDGRVRKGPIGPAALHLPATSSVGMKSCFANSRMHLGVCAENSSTENPRR